MTPRTEFADLVLRSIHLCNAVSLFLITFALLLVSVMTLFLTLWITVFMVGRSVADRWRARVTVQKGELPDVL